VVVEARLAPKGPYSLRLTTWMDTWHSALPGDEWASARQLRDGTILVRASSEEAVEAARFVLALDDDATEFHRRFAHDPLLGPSVRTLRGMRPRRTATVAHAALKAVCGQLIQSRRARDIERAVIRRSRALVPTRESLSRLGAADLCACGLAPSRAATLARLVRGLDLERLRGLTGDGVYLRLARERGIGPWSVGVIALAGLGRYDRGLVGDLALVKLQAALTGVWPDQDETAALLEPYEEWQGLASVFLLSGFARGLVPGADPDRARLARARAARAA
jgi:3-methyladenine DNA glycosylase/8-oxoguanine DNA glycosylase